jgi:hypothetical protein
VLYLNAWCELSGEDLSGRCPRSRVGLLPDPTGKGTDPCSTWTPSSPHFTSSSTIFASIRTANSDDTPGPPASLCQSEVITLSILARWSRFASERDFYRYAEAHLRGAFPTLPDRSQFNRLVRFHADALEEIAVKLGERLKGEPHPYQALDSSAMPVRDAKRRGHGWLAGEAYTSAGPTA